jgi:phage tail sheath gpL-like
MVAIQSSQVSRALGIEFQFRDLRGGAAVFLPQRIAVFGQGASASTYDTTKRRITSADEAGTVYGFGSPLHLAIMQLLPANGDGVGTIPVTAYPMEDNASGTTADGTITPGGTPTALRSFIVRINNIDSAGFNIAVGDAVADVTLAMTTAINSVSEMPVIAADGSTVVNLTSKWDGVSANGIVVEVINTTAGVDDDAGNTFVIVQPTGGTNNPTVDAGIAQIGDVWESLVLNCLDSADTTAMDAFSTWGDGRRNPIVAQDAAVFVGDTQTTVAGAITVPDARKTDQTNVQLVSPGSNDLPFVVAARQLAWIARIANDIPSMDYAGPATGLTPSTDADAWNNTERDQAVKGGSSTVVIKDGVVYIDDVVTFYHPTGVDNPAHRYLKDKIKNMQKSYNLKLIFEGDDWRAAALIPDDQPTTERTAKKPKMAKAEIAAMLDGLGLAAIISDPATAKKTIVAEISSTNPNRLNVSWTDQNSGNTNQKALTNYWGFYFGTATVVG